MSSCGWNIQMFQQLDFANKNCTWIFRPRESGSFIQDIKIQVNMWWNAVDEAQKHIPGIGSILPRNIIGTCLTYVRFQ